MKTVQECLREADWERLLDALAYDDLCDVHLLLECRDMTIDQIQDACKKRMNSLIEHLLTLDAEPSDHMVLYMVDASSFDRSFNNEYRSLNLIDLNEIRKDIYSSSYAFDLSDWKETLGYLVAGNKLTQDYMIDLLTQYLNEISFFGMDPEQHQDKVEEVVSGLEKAVEEVKEGGHTVPAEKVLDELREKHGLPTDEKDEFQKKLRFEILDAEMKYSRYCNWRERSRILKSLGDTAPSFEEAEEKQKEAEE
jgi:hypothetical protein